MNVNKLKVYGVEHISEVVKFFNEELELEETIVNTREEFYSEVNKSDIDFDQTLFLKVNGQLYQNMYIQFQDTVLLKMLQNRQ